VLGRSARFHMLYLAVPVTRLYQAALAAPGSPLGRLARHSGIKGSPRRRGPVDRGI